MKTIIEDRTHEVVYIEYINKIPHEVVTSCFITTAEGPYHRAFHWDFFPNNGDKNDIRAYNSGSGGNPFEIDAPQWGEGCNVAEYWISPKAIFKGIPSNGNALNKPRRLKSWYGNSSINPFKVAEIAFSSEYCEECGHESTEFCDEHKYIDNEGNARFKHDDSIAE